MFVRQAFRSMYKLNRDSDDNFNLYGLREVIGQSFRKCLDVILDRADADEVINKQ